MFRPNSKVTRAEFATFIARALDLDLAPYAKKFKDVDGKQYYARYVEAAAKAGIVSGVSKT